MSSHPVIATSPGTREPTLLERPERADRGKVVAADEAVEADRRIERGPHGLDRAVGRDLRAREQQRRVGA